MDFIAHSLWSLLLFPHPYPFLSVLFGVLPDFIPFSLESVKRLYHRQHTRFTSRAEMMDYYRRPENQWVKRLYHYTHSIFVWVALFLIVFACTYTSGIFPWYVFAWLTHILMDIPTHDKNSFCPQFLTPFSTFNIDGKHWSTKSVMIANYSLIGVGFSLRLIVYFLNR